MRYQYSHFRSEVMQEDTSFVQGPRPGERFPDFELPTTDGERLRKSDLIGRKPVLVTFASITCPMTADASSVLGPLYDQFQGRVAFVSLYVREAHPGENYPQPDSMGQKLQHARDYKRRDRIPWTVAVDDVEGTLHQTLDAKPNAAYLLDTDGRVFARILWSNDARGLRDAMQALVEGRPLHNPERTGKAIPMLRAMGGMDDVLGAAGSQARRDFRRELPPVYGMARLASLYRPLPPPARSIAAVVTALLAMGMVGMVGWNLLGKRSGRDRLTRR